jgi:hypothetical protein
MGFFLPGFVLHRCFTNSFSDTMTGAKMIKGGFVGTGKIVSVPTRGILVQFPTKDEGFCVKKKQLDAQLSIFRQPLHVSGVSRPIIRRYNRFVPIHPGQQTVI